MGMALEIGPLRAVMILDPAAKPHLDRIVRKAGGDLRKEANTRGHESLGLVLVDAQGREIELKASSMVSCLGMGLMGLALLFVIGGFDTLGHKERMLFLMGLVTTGLLALLARPVIQSYLSGKVPPFAEAESPDVLSELRAFTRRSVERLRAIHRTQLRMAIVVFSVLLLMLVWSVLMVTMSRLDYATALGGTSVGGLILGGTVWQPFDRAKNALAVANALEGISLGLRAQIEAISQMQDPQQRVEAQSRVVLEYTNSMKDWR